MAIVTISRGSFSHGREVAEGVAKKMGFDCFSREILVEASKEFNIPEIKLVRALHDAPSVLERFTYGKEKYRAYIEKALLERAGQDNVVYHGWAGHFFLRDLSHVLKVRILADVEDRVKVVMDREKVSSEEALAILKKDDLERRKWSLALYGIDTADPGLYDLVLHIQKLTVNDAVDLIRQAVSKPQFQTTPRSRQDLENLTLAARVKAGLVTSFPSISVTARDGAAFVDVLGDLSRQEDITNQIQEIARTIEGVKEVRVNVRPPVLFRN